MSRRRGAHDHEEDQEIDRRLGGVAGILFLAAARLVRFDAAQKVRALRAATPTFLMRY